MAPPTLICIDFGTSSIRAAASLRGGDAPVALALGDAFGSSIDAASIPSACFISKDESQVLFGESALRQGLLDRAMLFETSPKRWMTEGSASALRERPIPGLALAKKQLLVGLFAQAWSAIAKACDCTIPEVGKAKFRVAHPAWGGRVSGGLRSALYEIASEGLRVAGETNGSISVSDYQQLLEGDTEVAEYDVDVVEPVAAALYVHEARPASHEVCLLVDVGAGTTDIAAFVGYDPDSNRSSPKFIFAADPISVPKAGDVIDTAVEQLLAKKAHCSEGSTARADLRRRRRRLKEDVFKTGQAVFGGASVSREELESSRVVQEMAQEISVAVARHLRSAELRIKTFRGWGAGTSTLDVVFAGGGAGVAFLHKAVEEAARESTGMKVRVGSRQLPAKGLPASPERLAVSLGGTTPKRKWPETEMKEPKLWRGLPA